MVQLVSDWKTVLSSQEKYDRLHIMRYMGTKLYLLDLIIPRIKAIVRKGGTVLDLMAGTHSVGYALKKDYRIIANDVQAYSEVIGKAIIENNAANITKKKAVERLTKRFEENKASKTYHLFYTQYADTYFSKQQCLDIDSIKYAIDGVSNKHEKALYMSALIYAMCYAQSTTGHFAQFLPKDHKRIVPLRKLDVWKAFLEKCDNMTVAFSKYENEVLACDYKDLLTDKQLASVDLVYLDPPYSDAQYSRFYHILETLVKYDYPKTTHMGKYRTDRFMSGFCSKTRAPKEFELVMKAVSSKKKPLVISYSNKGVITQERLLALAKQHFKHVELYTQKYSHSSQGKGSASVKEILVVCTP